MNIREKATEASLKYDSMYSEDLELRSILGEIPDFDLSQIWPLLKALRQYAFRDGYIAALKN